MKQGDAPELLVYDFDSVLLATDNFNVKNELGQGWFAPFIRER